MRKNYMKKGLFYLLVFPLFLSGCKTSEIPLFDSKSMIYIEQSNFIDGSPVDLANLERSFALFPGDDEIEVSYTVNLIGFLADYDRPFDVVVDEMKTDTLKVRMTDGTIKKYKRYPAEPTEYEILPPVLKANATSADIVVTLKKSPRMDTDTVKVYFHLIPGEHFDLGYEDRLRAGVVFGNFPMKPSWWTLYIQTAYLGAYSPEKFAAFYSYCKGEDESYLAEFEKDDEDRSSSKLREIALGFKKYVKDNDLKEQDGTPMEIPIV